MERRKIRGLASTKSEARDAGRKWADRRRELALQRQLPTEQTVERYPAEEERRGPIGARSRELEWNLEKLAGGGGEE